MKNFVYLNDKFGSWSVIEIIKNESLVKCVCGTERHIKNAALITGSSRSCGKKSCHFDKENILNLRFGFLYVLSKVDYNIYNCKCICGNRIDVNKEELILGIIKSCGCKKSKISAIDVAIDTVLTNYKYHSKERNITFNLNREDFIYLIKGNCYYCGTPPSNTAIIKRTYDGIVFKYNGIDRKDSMSGYCLDNCVSCCWVCNRAKLNDSFEFFISWIEKLVLFRTGNN